MEGHLFVALPVFWFIWDFVFQPISIYFKNNCKKQILVFCMHSRMLNPSQPQKQVTGVFSLELARLYSYLLQQSTTDYSIVYSLDNYDEVSLTGSFKIIGKESEELFSPEDMGFKQIKADSLYGGNKVKEAAD